MLFCQLGQAHSLRKICNGLAGCFGKLKHLGISQSPKRSTLAYANEHRPWELFQKVFYEPGFENVENLIRHACRGMDISMISDYFGQQWSAVLKMTSYYEKLDSLGMFFYA